MDTAVYTLLIVESPTIAGIIQKMCPPSVYVMSTEGFCWQPKYMAKKNQIKAIADPYKLSIRNELQEQAKIAGSIVVAVDSDASGDFIAWSVSRFIKSSNVKRGQLQGLSRESIYKMLSNTTELDENQLESRLKNRFLIQQLWSAYSNISDIQLAGLISLFGTDQKFHSFLDEKRNLYKSTRPVHSQFGEWITVRSDKKSDFYKNQKPLSTFDVLEFIQSSGITYTLHEAQFLLHELFQTVLPFTEDSLISYPRTSAQAFYSDTWTRMRKQYLNIGPMSDLKPTYLQEIADDEEPHESINPIDLSLTPKSVAGELSQKIGSLYKWLYDQTLETLSMPFPLTRCYINDLRPDVGFYPESEEFSEKVGTIHPCVTISDLGLKMNEIGVIKPSKFGKTLDEWISKKWIKLEGKIISPGPDILKHIDKASDLHHKLFELNRLKDISELKPETVKAVITS